MIPILIVLYHPIKSTFDRIHDIAEHTTLFVFDNSSEPSELTSKSAIYKHSGTNAGIAGAMKWMVTQCEIRNIDCFLFFDQDTRFTHKTMTDIITYRLTIDKNISAVHFTSENKKYGSVRYVINSGTLYNVNVLRKISYIFTDYFVDAVDLAICYHSRVMGYKIICMYASDIDHYSDQGYKKWEIFGREIVGKIYSDHRRKSFYKGHYKLFLTSLQKLHIIDSYLILKYAVRFALDQFICDLMIFLRRVES